MIECSLTLFKADVGLWLEEFHVGVTKSKYAS